MWYEYLSKTVYLHKLYKIIPSLNDVQITKISINDEGNRITLAFVMPTYADFPPAKWDGYNVAVVEVDFFGISKLQLDTVANTYRGDISIEKNEYGLLEITVEGSLSLSIIADAGLIQRVDACLIRDEDER